MLALYMLVVSDWLWSPDCSRHSAVHLWPGEDGCWGGSVSPRSRVFGLERPAPRLKIGRRQAPTDRWFVGGTRPSDMGRVRTQLADLSSYGRGLHNIRIRTTEIRKALLIVPRIVIHPKC